MKRLFLLAAAIVAAVFVSCEYDDSELVNRVDDLEERVARLEELCNQTNTNLEALKVLVEAIDKRDYITDVTPLTENGSVVGYTIKFAKSNPVVIYNGKDGKDGHTPQIAVKRDTDGLYYWTLDGEFIVVDGQKIKAQATDGKDGADGKDAITPQLKIEEDYWWISYDNGSTWSQLGKATGEDGKDNQGITVNQDGEFVYFTLADGTVIKVPKSELDAWKHIPTDVFTGEGLDLVLNGEQTAIGSMQLVASSNTQAQLTLTDVVTGYPALTIPVELVEHNDGTFEFSAETGLTTPGRATENVVFLITVKGKVSREGKISTSVATRLTDSAKGQLAGMWPLSKDLRYMDEDEYETYYYPTTPMQFVWSAIDKNQTNAEQLATLGKTLLSQILSEVISDISFEADGNLTATYYPTLITDKAYSEEEGEFYDVQTYLDENGMAEYYDATTWWIMSKLLMEQNINVYPRQWKNSPKNLISWYVENDQIYLLPNLPQILARVAADGAQFDPQAILEIVHSISAATDEELKELLAVAGQLIDPEGKLGIDLTTIDIALIRQVLGFLETGVPLKYSVENGTLKLFIDKAMAAPFMEVILKFMPVIDKLLADMAAENSMIGMVTMMLGVEKFEDYQTVWAQNTQDFMLGLCFKQGGAAAAAPKTSPLGVSDVNTPAKARQALIRRYGLNN